VSYDEKRVRVRHFGTMPRRSQLLIVVPSAKGTKRLHKLAAAAMLSMAEAVKRDLGIELKIISGWRPHRWRSKKHYEDTLIQKYGSVQKGRKWLAYASPHETGLAMDIGVGGLWPSSKTAKAQREQPLHRWLVEHAWEFGWHPYKREPWHWEYPISKNSWDTGEPDADEAVAFGLEDEYDDFDEDDEVVEADFDDDAFFDED
jgi:LAS superfamily LD-carboxypeptidase LdcB